jgi:hypothetical protein
MDERRVSSGEGDRSGSQTRTRVGGPKRNTPAAGWLQRSKRAEDEEEPSVVDKRLNLDEAMEFAYGILPEDFGVGVGLLRWTKRMGPSLRQSKSWRPVASRG